MGWKDEAVRIRRIVEQAVADVRAVAREAVAALRAMRPGSTDTSTAKPVTKARIAKWMFWSGVGMVAVSVVVGIAAGREKPETEVAP